MRIYALIFYSMLIFKFQEVFSPPVIFCNVEREGITVLKCCIWIFFGVILIIALVQPVRMMFGVSSIVPNTNIDGNNLHDCVK